MKISNNMLWAILIISVAMIFIVAIVYSGSNDFVETTIISHTTHGDGYQLVDSVHQRACVIYPDALELGDRLDCYGSAK